MAIVQYPPNGTVLKTDANGNVLANINAQNINPNVNNVAGNVAGSVGSVSGNVGGSVLGSVASVGNIKLDANGYVESNIYAQNINPNVNVVSGINKDANGNVLANINAQNINPNVNNVAGSVAGSVGSVASPPVRHKFMTNLITSTTSSTNITLGTYTSSNGIGIVDSTVYNSNSVDTYFSLYNGTTELGSLFTAINYSDHLSFAYAPQGTVTLSLEGYVGGSTGYYDVTVYEVF